MGKLQQWMLFRHISVDQHYFWNGLYPINVTRDGVAWNPDGEINDSEISIITSVLSSRKMTFSIKGRGTFKVVTKGVFVTP